MLQLYPRQRSPCWHHPALHNKPNRFLSDKYIQTPLCANDLQAAEPGFVCFHLRVTNLPRIIATTLVTSQARLRQDSSTCLCGQTKFIWLCRFAGVHGPHIIADCTHGRVMATTPYFFAVHGIQKKLTCVCLMSFAGVAYAPEHGHHGGRTQGVTTGGAGVGVLGAGKTCS